MTMVMNMIYQLDGWDWWTCRLTTKQFNRSNSQNLAELLDVAD